MGKRIVIALLSIVLLSAGLAGSLDAAGKVKASGILTAVEQEGSTVIVIVDGKGYAVDSFARIVDARGKTVTLDKLELPAQVQFEFVYTEQGPVIQVIKQIAR